MYAASFRAINLGNAGQLGLQLINKLATAATLLFGAQLVIDTADGRQAGCLQYARRAGQRTYLAAGPSSGRTFTRPGFGAAARRHPEHRTRANLQPVRVRCYRRSAARSALSM